MLPLHTQQIDLWCTFPNEIVDPTLLATYRRLLSPAEQQQQQQFYFAKDRHRYLLTRTLARTVLARYMSIPAEQLIFSVNAYHKPFIADQTVSFNITHSDDLIILAATRDNALGIDTENTQREITTELAEYSFATKEIADFLSQPIEQRQQRFFEYWTLKESYIKARGMGLSIPLKEFSFHFPDQQKINFTVHPKQNDSAAHWRFWQLEVAKNYLAALCAEAKNAHPPLLTLRQIVPLVSEKNMDYRLLRKSVNS